MESDYGQPAYYNNGFGFDESYGDDDDDLDYTYQYGGYDKSAEQHIEEEEGNVDEPDPNNDKSLYLAFSEGDMSDDENQEENVATKKKGMQRGSRGGRKSRNRKESRLSGSELFNRLVLSWHLPQLIKDSREALGLSKLCAMPNQFASKCDYYDSLAETTIEECRAVITNEYLGNKQNQFSQCSRLNLCMRANNGMNIERLLDHSGNGILLLLDFKILGGDMELVKPGSVFILKPSTSGLMNDSYQSKIGSNNNKRILAPDVHNNNRKAVKQNEKTQNLMHENDAEILASIAQTSEAISLQTSTDSKCLPVWIHSSYARRYQKLLLDGSNWSAYGLASIISYQRMFVACKQDLPSPPFILKLLGYRPRSHIKFEDDDNSNLENSYSEAAETNQSTKLPTSPINASQIKFDSSIYDWDEPKSGLAIASESGSLNSSQLAALHDCINEICSATSSNDGHLKLVQGPPGTGKTHFLVMLLEALVHEGKRVLVSAPSNKAVCVALEKFLCSRCPQSTRNMRSSSLDVIGTTNIYQPIGMCTLIGVEDKLENCSTISASMASLSESKSTSCLMKNMKSVNRDECLESLMLMWNVKNQNTDQSLFVCPCSLLPLELTDQFDSLVRPTSASDLIVYNYVSKFCDLLRKVASFIKHLAANISIVFTRFENKTSLIELKYCCAVMKALQCEVATTFDVLYRYSPNLFINFIDSPFWTPMNNIFRSFFNEILKCLFSYQTQSSSIRDGEIIEIAKEPKSVPTIDYQHLSELLIELSSHLDPTACTLSSNTEFIKRFPEECIQNADVVFCTLAYTGHGIVKRNVFGTIDVLIVDEAAQSFEAELVIALSSEPKNMILIGDPQQLPATIISKQAQKLDLGISTMQRLINTFHFPVLLLDTQYRMHPDISRYPNLAFYSGRLRDSNSVTTRYQQQASSHGCISAFRKLVAVGLGSFNNITSNAMVRDSTSDNFHFSFWDIKGVESSGGRYGKSVSNHPEAVLIARLVVFLHKIHENDINIEKQVCIITFYSGQVQAIQNCLRRMLGNHLASKVRVMTVDSFQGSESDCVILSFVRCNARSVVGFLNDYQRLNVALTRAKHILIAVGNKDTLLSSVSGGCEVLMNEPSAPFSKKLVTLRDFIVDVQQRSLICDSSKIDKFIAKFI